jgi:RNase P subunit RPR2
MGLKAGGGAPKTAPKPSEAMMRMNFLAQASRAAGKVVGGRVLSTHLGHLLVGVGRKAVVRQSKELKRAACKGCHISLFTNNFSSVTVTGRAGNRKITYQCRQCGKAKRIPFKKKTKSPPSK